MPGPRRQHVVLVLASLFALSACENDTPKPEKPSAPEAPKGKVEIVAAKDGDATRLIRSEAERARTEGKELLVYVGASWCEPCQYFHKAAVAGQLDGTFPRLRLLEFDYDRDSARLESAGCLSRFIPLFAKPDPSGRCSDQRIEGSIKGEGAVAEITPRLLRLVH